MRPDELKHAVTRDNLRHQGNTTTATHGFHYFLTPDEAQALLPVEQMDVVTKKFKRQPAKVHVRTCPICNDLFETKQYNKVYCSPACHKEHRRRMFRTKYNATPERKKYNADKQREGKVQTGWDDPITEEEKHNLTSALIRAVVAQAVQDYRNCDRWERRWAEIFLTDYGNLYMAAVGERVDFDFILNTIDKEVGR